MRYRLTLAIGLAICVSVTSAHAQVLRKFFYNKKWELTTKDSTVYIRMCAFDTTNSFFAGPITDMYPSGKPQMKGTYKGWHREGEFTFYYANGQVESAGMYSASLRNGVWNYFHSNGKQKAQVVFNIDKVTEIMSLTDSTGNTIATNDLTWFEKHQADKFKNTQEFAAATGITFKDYPFLRTMKHGATIYVLDRADPTGMGSPEETPIVEVPPSPKNGMQELYTFINKTLRYPANARRMGTQGKVMVEFVVDNDGSLSDFKVKQGIGNGCDEEAIRIMTEYGKKYKWNPGTQAGKAVKSRMIMPVSFRLG